MSHSLRGRLTILFLLMTGAAVAAAALFFALFQLSTAAQASQAQAELARGCDAIGEAYRFFAAGWSEAEASKTSDAELRRSLPAVVITALRDHSGMEGGIRRAGGVSLAYAYPTYPGGSAKTDEPAAELPRIQAANASALAEDRLVAKRFDAATQILLIDSCPLPGPVPGLTAWTMTRVQTFAGQKYSVLMQGLGVLLALLLASAALMGQLVSSWRGHVQRIEATLKANDVASLPRLAPTGEKELDQIIGALNDLGERLAIAQAEGERMGAQLAASERLAALGRIAAGVAHEIRNPIAAMRLRAETALTAPPDRQVMALEKIVALIDRLDRLVARLLQGATETRPRYQRTDIPRLLETCAEETAAAARAKSIKLTFRPLASMGVFDPEQIRDALVNLIENAIEAGPDGSTVDVSAREENDQLVFAVRNAGRSLDPQIRKSLFEPFVTTRAEGVGLGLAVVREIARSHRGEARLAEDGPDFVCFEIALPCPQS